VESKNLKKGFLLFAILLVGLFLRIYNLDREGIWFDEGGSARYANLNIPQLFETVSSGDCTPPLYYVVLHYWIGIFGESEFSLRFPSVVFSFFSIFVIYKLGTLLFNKDVGLISSLILSISGFHIYYSQEARSYSLLVLLALLSFYFFIKTLNNRKSAVSIAYIISIVLLLYTHVYGLFIIIAQNIYFFSVCCLSRKSIEVNIRTWILFQCIIAIAFTPWILGGFIKQAALVQHYHWYSAPSISRISKSFQVYSGSRGLLIFFLVFSFLSFVSFKQFQPRNIDWKNTFSSFENYKFVLSISNVNKIYFLLVCFFSSIILPFLISLITTPIFVIRHTIVASIALYLLTAKGIENTFENCIRSKTVKLLIIGLLIFFSAKSIWKNFTIVNKEQWKEATNFINIYAQPNDLILFYPGDENILFIFDYYSKRADIIKKPVFKTIYINDENIKELMPVTENFNRVWFVQRLKDPKVIIKNNFCHDNNLIFYKKFTSRNFREGNEEFELFLFEKKLIPKLKPL